MESGTVETGIETKNGASGNGGAAEKSIEVSNPATGERVATVAIDSPEAVAEKVARVRANQAEW